MLKKISAKKEDIKQIIILTAIIISCAATAEVFRFLLTKLANL